MQKLKYFRKQKGFTMKDVGKKLNVAENTISQWERGKRKPSFQTLVDLAKLYDCSVDDFVDEAEGDITENRAVLNIRGLRQERGLTATELAEKLGVAVCTVSHWESGKRAPRGSEIVRIAEILDCSIDDLFGYSTKKEDEPEYRVGLKIREYRKAKHLTMKQIGEAVNATEGTVSLWERGKREPSIGNIKKIAQILGCSISDLLGETEEATAEWVNALTPEAYKCSACGGTPLYSPGGNGRAFLTITEFCPHCGAKMSNPLADDDNKKTDDKFELEVYLRSFEEGDNITVTCDLLRAMEEARDIIYAQNAELVKECEEHEAFVEKAKEEIERARSATISKWVEVIHENAVAHGWYDDRQKNFGELLMLITTETAEAMEEYRNGRGFKEIYHDKKGKMCGIPSELADIVIRVMDLCGYYGIDLEEAIKNKHEYNKARPYKHGGKKC